MTTPTAAPRSVGSCCSILTEITALRILIGCTLAWLMMSGPYGIDNISLAHLIAPQTPLATMPHTLWIAWRWILAGLGICYAGNIGGASIRFLTFGLFLGFNGLAAQLTAAWNYNTHLHVFMLALSGLDLARARRWEFSGRDCIVFCRWWVGLIYLQAGLSKLIYGGIAWITTGQTLWAYVQIFAQPLAQPLLAWKSLFPILSTLSLLFELSFFPAVILGASPRLLGLAGIAFHLGTTALMGISFFHLWILFPGIFGAWNETRAATQSGKTNDHPDCGTMSAPRKIIDHKKSLFFNQPKEKIVGTPFAMPVTHELTTKGGPMNDLMDN